MSKQKIMQNIYTVQYFVFYILPLVIFVKKVVYRREMMGEYLKAKEGNRDIKIGIDTLEVFSVPCLC